MSNIIAAMISTLNSGGYTPQRSYVPSGTGTAVIGPSAFVPTGDVRNVDGVDYPLYANSSGYLLFAFRDGASRLFWGIDNRGAGYLDNFSPLDIIFHDGVTASQMKENAPQFYLAPSTGSDQFSPDANGMNHTYAGNWGDSSLNGKTLTLAET